VKKDSIVDIIDYLSNLKIDTKFMISSPLNILTFKSLKKLNKLTKESFDEIKNEVLSS
jgi:hypothetical protein